jgi:hypothetical protein
MTNIKIGSSLEHRNSLLAVLVNAGFSREYHKTVEQLGMYNNWAYVLIEPRDPGDPRDPKQLNFCNDSWHPRKGDSVVTFAWPFQATEVLDYLSKELKKSQPVTMQLTDDYSAVVSIDGITVGCQDITWEKFDELSEIAKEIRNL